MGDLVTQGAELPLTTRSGHSCVVSMLRFEAGRLSQDQRRHNDEMDKLLDYYTVTAERNSGFWIGLPVATGMTVARAHWLQLMEDDPDHFQLVTLTAEGLTNYSMAVEDVIERAVFVTWSDEVLQ